MEVRKTTVQDLELLVQLRVDFLMDQNQGKEPENKDKLVDNLRLYFEKAMDRNEFIAVVAEEEGKAVSTAFLSIAERPPRPGNSSNRVGTIYSVFTYPKYRRRGMATKVLQLLLQEAEKSNVATVDLSATEDGRPLYEKLGFKLPKYTYMKLNLDDRKQNGIRPMKEAEIPACVDLIRRSFRTVADEFGFTVENAPRFTAFATTVERLQWQYEQKRPMYVYENADGEIVGYYSLNLQDDGECELNNLCVEPGYRHRKIGEELYEHAVTAAKENGCTVMNIGIVEENQKLREWYEKLGAEHVGTKKFDFFPFTCGYLKKNLRESNVVTLVQNEIMVLCEKYKNEAEDHYDFWNEHIKFVLEESVKLAEEYQADREIVELGALLHDVALVCKVGTRKDHHINGKLLADEILSKYVYDADRKERVLSCVLNHRSSKNATNIEERCVADADILAHFDNIPMLFNSAIRRNQLPITGIREGMKESFEIDFNDLSEETQKKFGDRYQLIREIIFGKS